MSEEHRDLQAEELMTEDESEILKEILSELGGSRRQFLGKCRRLA
jgi:hypothetical protein